MADPRVLALALYITGSLCFLAGSLISLWEVLRKA